MATESFFSNASLAYLASAGAGKDGKTYSIKPTDGSGDFTFSRGSNLAATRVGPTGLIEKGRENLLLQSNTFSNASWLKELGTTLTSGQSGYDGSSDAWLLDTNGTQFSRLRQTLSSNGVQTFSIYAKAGTLDWIGLYNGGASGNAFFDLNNGVTGNSNAIIDTSITSVGNGWYRCEYSSNQSITDVRIYLTDANGTFTTTAGNIYIQSAQLEIGLAATEVIESGATTGKAGLLEDEPRFDYSGGATCPSLLLEPSRTNLFGQSEYFGSGFWVKNDLNISIGFTSPDGLTNASKLAATTSNSVHKMRASTIVTPAVGTTVTFSIYCKPQEIAKIALVDNWTNLTYSVVNLSTNSVIEEVFYTGTGSTAITEMANGFKRISFTYQTASINTQPSVYLLDDSYTSGNPTSYTFASDGSSGVIAYGAQLEQGSYPTSYIPNHSGTGSVTRGADDELALTTAGTDGILNNYNTSVYIETKNIAADNTLKRLVSLYADNKAANPRVLLYAISTTIFLQYRVTGQSDVLISLSSVDLDAVNKFAIVLNDTNISLYHNGSLFQNTTIVKGLNFEEFYIAENRENGYSLNQVLIFPESLSQADAETLTT